MPRIKEKPEVRTKLKKERRKIAVIILLLISAAGICLYRYVRANNDTETRDYVTAEGMSAPMQDNTGGAGNTDGAGNADNTGGAGNAGNAGSIGGTGNRGSTGNAGGAGNTGSIGNTGSTGNAGGMEKEAAISIVGTWRNTPDTETEEWKTTYRTRFSPDGKVVHYGSRNVDIGSWEQTGDTITAYYEDCYYLGTANQIYMLPAYSVTYQCREVFTDGRQEVTLARNTDRKAEIPVKVKTEQGTEYYTATDFDDYELSLYYENDASEVEEHYQYCTFPHMEENNEPLRQALLEMVKALPEGGEAQLERADLPYALQKFSTYDITGDGREEIFAYVEPVWQWDSADRNHGAFYILSPTEEGDYAILAENTDFLRGYTDILVPDGTEVFSQRSYASASSWKGGIRLHLGFREGQIVVDREESYGFHWDNPLINYVNDYKNGIYYVYVARNPDEGKAEGYGCYAEIEDSIKIDEENFEPVFLPFTGYEPRSNDYPAVYPFFHPFPEDWWEDGGRYPEDVEGEDYLFGVADWIEEAADDNPDEMLKEAVEDSGYEMERVAYPWTEETKENVARLLRCPVADYYYVSDKYAAYYARGEVYFCENN